MGFGQEGRRGNGRPPVRLVLEFEGEGVYVSSDGGLWRRFEIPDLPAPNLACVMATVPANELIRRTVKAQEDDPRMPAILEDDVWATCG